MAGLRVLAARTVGHGQLGGQRQHQPVAAHPRPEGSRIPAAGLVPLPTQGVPDGLQNPEALLNPVAADIQGRLRLRHRGVGQPHLTGVVQYTPKGPLGGLQRRVPESPPGTYPQVARSRNQRAHRDELRLACGLKGDVGRVTQAGMPAQRAPQGPILRPQVPTTAQPLVTEHRHRHRGRHGRGQPAQQAAEMVNPGLPCLRPHDVPSYRDGVLAIDHTNQQGHQLILFAGALGARIHRQHQRFLVHLPPVCGHTPAAHPLQPRGEAALHFQLLTRTPGINAIRIVI